MSEPASKPPWLRPEILLWVVLCLAFSGVAYLAIAPYLLEPGGRESFRRPRCLASLKMIGVALQNYHDQHKSFPPAIITDEAGQPMHSWRVLILPYLDDNDALTLYEQYRFNEPWNGPNNSKLHDRVPNFFRCPSDEINQVETNYVAVVGEGAAWPGKVGRSIREMSDGASQTIAVVETTNSGIHWLEPRDLSLEQAAYGINPVHGAPAVRSHHAGKVHVLMANCIVRTINGDVPATILRALLTANGGEDVDIPND